MTDVVSTVVVESTNTVVSGPLHTSIVVSKQTQGVPIVSGQQGPKGAAGGTSIGGIPVVISSVEVGDLLSYTADHVWSNNADIDAGYF